MEMEGCRSDPAATQQPNNCSRQWRRVETVETESCLSGPTPLYLTKTPTSRNSRTSPLQFPPAPGQKTQEARVAVFKHKVLRWRFERWLVGSLANEPRSQRRPTDDRRSTIDDGGDGDDGDNGDGGDDQPPLLWLFGIILHLLPNGSPTVWGRSGFMGFLPLVTTHITGGVPRRLDSGFLTGGLPSTTVS